MSKQHWSAEETTYRISNCPTKPIMALKYDPTPGGKRNLDGTTSYSLVFPALLVTEWVADGPKVAQQIAAELNNYPKLVTALEAISGMKGMTLLAGSLGEDGDRAHQIGANKAFEQAASIADAALKAINAGNDAND